MKVKIHRKSRYYIKNQKFKKNERESKALTIVARVAIT